MNSPKLASLARRLLAFVRRHPTLDSVLGLAALALGGIAWSFMPSALPAPAPWVGALPPASPPATMAIYQVPTGTYQTPAALAFRGGSFAETRDFAATAVLVRHPNGDLLFDAGFGAHVDKHIRLLPSYERAPYRLGEPVKVQLAAAGYDFTRLKGVVVTHAHWDHVSGLEDLSVPAWMNAAEQRYASEDHPETRAFRSFSGVTIQTYAFDGPPYLAFPASHDVWGDGSVVLVPAPGHTPGSIIAFIATPTGKRYALLGDLTWQLDGLQARAERPLMMRVLADSDANRVRDDLLRVIALEGRMELIPAHDLRAYADLPRL